MTCPWCGAPVMIRGSQWECGYCGDHGFLAPSAPQQQKENTPPKEGGRRGRALLWTAAILAVIGLVIALRAMG